MARNGSEVRLTHSGGRGLVPDAAAARFRGGVYLLFVEYLLHGRGHIPGLGGDTLDDHAGRRRDLAPHRRVAEAFGARLDTEDGGWTLQGPPPTATDFSILDDGISATACAMLVAATCAGRTVIHDASPEPEIVDLAAVLDDLGAPTSVNGRTVTVTGPLRADGQANVPGDRMLLGTLAVITSLTSGRLTIDGTPPRIEPILAALRSFGVEVACHGGELVVSGPPQSGADLGSGLYPSFPSDLLPIFTVLAAVAPGPSRLSEGIYLTRWDHLEALERMGLSHAWEGETVVLPGGVRFRGARLRTAGIRESCAAFLAALVADGPSDIDDGGSLARGYQDLAGWVAQVTSPNLRAAKAGAR